MARLIGIEDTELQTLIVEAYKRGYAEATAEAKATTGEWLNSRAEICEFLNPEKPVSVTTFNRNRAAGMYGAAIVGRGAKCKARRQDLLNAIYCFDNKI